MWHTVYLKTSQRDWFFRIFAGQDTVMTQAENYVRQWDSADLVRLYVTT